MSESLRFDPNWTVHPGEILDESLSERGWSQMDLVRATGFTPKHINEVIAGKSGIGVEFALALESALEIRAEFWLNAQLNHDLFQARAVR